MNSSDATVTVKLQIRYGWDESIITEKDALWNAIQLAINPDFSEVYKGTYLNGVRVFNENNEILTYV